MSLVTDLMNKAARAVRSAQLLFDAGDYDGACSRAYYAMFDAARAALITCGVMPESVKTHSSLVGLFGQHLVKTGTIARDLGKAVNDVQEIRMLADYLPAAVPADKAAWAVTQAGVFVDAVQALPQVQAQLTSPQGPARQL